jgi:hypothetical protein
LGQILKADNVVPGDKLVDYKIRGGTVVN